MERKTSVKLYAPTTTTTTTTVVSKPAAAASRPAAYVRPLVDLPAAVVLIILAVQLLSLHTLLHLLPRLLPPLHRALPVRGFFLIGGRCFRYSDHHVAEPGPGVATFTLSKQVFRYYVYVCVCGYVRMRVCVSVLRIDSN
jgi:hypothetical protein